MKCRDLCSILFFVVGGALSAHDSTVILEPGQSLWGWNWYVNASNVVWASVDADGTTAEVIQVSPSQSEFRSNWSGDVFSWEYALARGWSLGIKTNPYNFLGLGLVRGKWDLQAAVFTNVDLTPVLGPEVQASPFRLFGYQELQLAPVFTTAPGFGDGLLNSISSLSANWRWVDEEQTMISTYLDTKVITTVAHPYYRFKWMQKEFYGIQLYLNGLEPGPDLRVEFSPTARLAVELGLEARLFTDTIVYGGFNQELALLYRAPDGGLASDFGTRGWFDLLDAALWELEVKFRLR